MQKLFFSLQTDLKKRKDPSAFTLLELLIGMTIFAVIAASVYASMYLGVKLYRYDEKNHDAMLEAEAVIDEMSAELSCAFMNEDNKRLKFKGSEESVDFFSVGRKGDIRRVVYYLEPQESPGKEERLVKLIQKYLSGSETFREWLPVLDKEFSITINDNQKLQYTFVNSNIQPEVIAKNSQKTLLTTLLY